jgi:integrase
MEYLEQKDLSKLFRTIHEAGKTSEAAKADHMIALLQFFTGARISQVLAIKGEDIFQHEEKWVVKIGAAKRGFERVHPLHLDADAAFDMLPLVALAQTRRTSLLFGQSHRSNFNLRLKAYCATSNIHPDYGHSHIFRHSLAVFIWDQTHRLGAISWKLAHRSMASSLIYLAEGDGKIAQNAVDVIQLA